MKFSTNFAAMLKLVGRIKFSLNCSPSLKLHDITHAQYTYTHLFTGRISKLGMHSLQSYGCVRITSWITLVIHTILMLIAFTNIIAVNLNLLSQILGVHTVSVEQGLSLQNESNLSYTCSCSAATSENILPLQYINIQTLQNMRAYVRELIWLL